MQILKESNQMKPGGQINISGKPEDSDGVYSNVVLISFSRAEFVLDFARIMPGVPNGRLKSRIIMSPLKVRSLIGALEKQLSQYEDRYGKMEDTDPMGQIGFQAPQQPVQGIPDQG